MTTSEETLRDFRLRLAQQRRQGWHVIEHDEERLHALLFKEESRERAVGGRRTKRTAVRRSWQRLWVDDRGRVRSGPGEPPPLESETTTEPQAAAPPPEPAPEPEPEPESAAPEAATAKKATTKRAAPKKAASKPATPDEA
jgi:hypothetical protein